MKILGVEEGIIAIEDNKPDVIELMCRLCAEHPGIRVCALQTKYPQGGEKQLIHAVLNREVPSGGIPADIGVVVQSVATAAAAARAVITGMPTIGRAMTVSGYGVNSPRNLVARYGTLVEEIIDHCGGMKNRRSKILLGGPMMGVALYQQKVPVTKGVNGIIVLTPEESAPPEVTNCIRCGKCTGVCPMRLMPGRIADCVRAERYDGIERLRVMDCMECGCCSYICPARLYLTQSIRLAKRAISQRLLQQRKEVTSR